MYLKLFGLNEKPFHITPNPRFIFLSKNHKEAFAHLLYGIQQRVGFLALTGEVGTGKTTVLRTLLQQLEESEYRVALVFNPCLTAIELLQSIHREFAIAFDVEKDNLVSLHDSLNRFLLSQREAGLTVVLVVDEAQNLDPAVLEQLRLLSNLETETEKLIQMVLVGQPELDELFTRNDLRQLRQRLAVRYQLAPMDAEDSCRYIQHRLRIAGWENGALFTDKALARVFRITGGTPRLINILCDRALLVAYSRDSGSVNHQDVAEAQRELGHKELQTSSKLIPALAGFALAILLVLASWQLMTRQPEPVAAVEAVASAVQMSPAVAQDVAAPIMVTAAPVVTRRVPKTAVSSERVQQLQQAIAELSVVQGAKKAYLSTTQRWGRKPIKVPNITNRFVLKDTFNRHGFDAIDFQGELSALLSMEVPAILEIVLPNITGKRYLALVEESGEQVRTVPKITSTGWLAKRELRQVWFGRATLPYLNYDKIRMVDTPGQSGTDTEKLQQLLQSLYGQSGLSSGRYDRTTIEAVTRFQVEHQLSPDGRVGAQTLFWLYKAAGKQMPQLGSGGKS